MKLHFLLFTFHFSLLTLLGCRTLVEQPPEQLANEVSVRPTQTASATATPASCVAVQQTAVLTTQPPTTSLTVVQTYPHDSEAFTQGLLYLDGQLIEGTGLRGRSTVRRVELETGEVLQSIPIAEFGEGTAVFNNKLYQLTWQANKAYVYDATTFELLRTFSYEGEGWGLTNNGRCLIMSNGSNIITYRDPETFTIIGEIQVIDERGPVSQLNELEWINGEIWANIWQTNRIARIDPASGAVLGWLDATPLAEQTQPPNDRNAVLNGIAFDAENERVFLTGKLWPLLFEVLVNE